MFWLQAPAHPGKSLFVRGLAELSEAGGEQWLLNDLQVAGVFIRRDYRYGPGQILPLLEQVLKRALDVAERADRRLPQIDLAASDPAAACARFVADYRALSDVGGRLLIVFDGLDELRPPSPVAACSTSSPRRANSPACVCVLLTSRPLGDGSCPHWIGQRLQRLRAAEGLRVHRGAPDDPGYLQLLHDYFEPETEATRARLEAVAVQAGTAPEKARADTRQRFTDLFPVLLDKAHGLFLYFAFLLDRIQERELPLDALALQLGGEVLHTDFIETLADALAAKQAELARTLLLTLAAVEQAHAWYVLEREPPYAVEPDWRGLPLDSLAELIHYPGMDGDCCMCRSALKSVLGAWRGDSASSARYRLGLKDRVASIAAHRDWGPALTSTHRRLAAETLALLSAPTAAEGENQPVIDDSRLRYGFAHAALAEEGVLLVNYLNAPALSDRLLAAGNEAWEQARHTAASRWYSKAVLIGELRRAACEWQQAEWPTEWQIDLASVYRNRGLARFSDGYLAGAVADYDAAIGLREQISDRLRAAGGDGAWSVPLRNGLATVFQNRGNARFSGGDLAGALADWQQAASPQRDLAERGSFSALTSFLKLQVGVVAVAASLPDWETAARTLPAFMRTVAAQEQAQDDDGEKAIAEAGGNEEARPWQDKVEAFVALVQTYDATQRAQILEQLDESDAAWVATNLGGHAGA